MSDGSFKPASPSKFVERLRQWATPLILLALVLGAVTGELLHRQYGSHPPAVWENVFLLLGQTLFMGALKMVLVPMVALSLICSLGTIASPAMLGSMAFRTIACYWALMVLAAAVGIALMTFTHPGAGLDATFLNDQIQQFAAQSKPIEVAGHSGLAATLMQVLTQLIPPNPLGAISEGKLLPVISLSLLLGGSLAALGEAGRPALAVAQSLLAGVLKIVQWILLIAPLGVFGLIAATVLHTGVSNLAGPLGKYFLVVIAGLCLIALMLLPAVLYLRTRQNPYRYLWAMREALLTGFTTTSSAATMPVTITCAQDKGGVPAAVAEFVIPLGTAGNLVATAFFEAAATIFLFQCLGTTLSPVHLLTILITSVLATAGTASLPSAGLVAMGLIIESVNGLLDPAQRVPIAAIGIIFGIDHVIDMVRTPVNVLGYAVVAKLIASLVR